MEPRLERQVAPRALRQLGVVGPEVVVEVIAPSFSHRVIRQAKVVMEQLLGVPPDPHHLALLPHPSVRAWVVRQQPMPRGRPLGQVGLGARPILLVSPKGSWDHRPMGRDLEGVKHRT